jgi:hypothetical protein
MQDYPRQGDDRHPHYYNVVRGNTFDFPTAENPNVIVKPGQGPPYELCTSCHGAKHDPVTGIPGTTNPNYHPGEPFWALAPALMAREPAPGIPLSGPQLCPSLLNMKLNGHEHPSSYSSTSKTNRWSSGRSIPASGRMVNRAHRRR